MRRLCTVLAVGGLLALTGCNNTSNTGGGGRVATTGPHSTGPAPGASAGTFKLKGPLTSTTFKHGETKDVQISVSKSNDFKENVNFRVSVEPADKGVTAKLDKPMWTPSDPPEMTVHVTATDKAAAGDYTVKVAATPAVGGPTEVDFKVKVPEKK